MDRDKRWERVKVAVEGLIKGEGEASEDPIATIKERYKKDETDEFLKPIIIGGDEGRIKGTRSRAVGLLYLADRSSEGDTLFLFNYRSDRMREIATVLGKLDDVVDTEIPKDLVCPFVSSARYWLIVFFIAHHHHVEVQCRVSLPSCLPSPAYDGCPRRMAFQEGSKPGTHRGNREVRPRHLLLQRWCREAVRE
jgi:hypothetical protein